MKRKDVCPSCKVPWISHLGIQGTCKKLRRAEGALRVIRTWSAVEGALDPKLVQQLCEKVLEEIK